MQPTVTLTGGPNLEQFTLPIREEAGGIVADVPDDVREVTGWAAKLAWSPLTGRWLNVAWDPINGWAD